MTKVACGDLQSVPETFLHQVSAIRALLFWHHIEPKLQVQTERTIGDVIHVCAAYRPAAFVEVREPLID
jgi:hypothetical protein